MLPDEGFQRTFIVWFIQRILLVLSVHILNRFLYRKFLFYYLVTYVVRMILHLEILPASSRSVCGVFFPRLLGSEHLVPHSVLLGVKFMIHLIFVDFSITFFLSLSPVLSLTSLTIPLLFLFFLFPTGWSHWNEINQTSFSELIWLKVVHWSLWL